MSGIDGLDIWLVKGGPLVSIPRRYHQHLANPLFPRPSYLHSPRLLFTLPQERRQASTLSIYQNLRLLGLGWQRRVNVLSSG